MKPFTDPLPWPREAARPDNPHGAQLALPGSNIALDLHGDPVKSKLVIFSDGNHHMALADVTAAFLRAWPDAGDVFYLTTPPRILIETLRSGALSLGNLTLTLEPHVFISPREIVTALAGSHEIGTPAPFMRSRGLSILVAKGNPKSVRGIADLIRADIRLAISNPQTEKASFTVYAGAICRNSPLGADETLSFLHGRKVITSSLIHNREIPQIIASGLAHASLIYHHLTLRHVRIFADQFDIFSIYYDEIAVTEYMVSICGEGGLFGAQLVSFLHSDTAAEIFHHHGLHGSH